MRVSYSKPNTLYAGPNQHWSSIHVEVRKHRIGWVLDNVYN